VSRLTDLIATDLVPLEDRANDLRLTQGAADVTSSVPHNLLYSLSSFGTYVVYGPAPSAPLTLEITVANATTPIVRDPLRGTPQPPVTARIGPQANRFRISLPAAVHPLIVDFSAARGETFGSSVEVRNEALPRVEEVIFRHQQAQAAQDAVLQNYIARVRI